MGRGRRVALLCTVAIAWYGCGSDVARDTESSTEAGAPATDSAAAPSGGPKACDVIAADDLARITGLQLEEGRLTNDYGGVSQCRWRRAGGTDDGVTVSVREQGDMAIYTSVPGAVAVQGIGDEAVWNPNSHQMAFRVGPRIASVTFLFDEGTEAWAREIAGVIRRALPVPDGPAP